MRDFVHFWIISLRADQLETPTSSPQRAKPEHYWIVQIPAPLGQNIVQMPYPIVGIVGQMSLLNNKRRRLLSSMKLV